MPADDLTILVEMEINEAMLTLNNRPFHKGEPIQVWLFNRRIRITTAKLGIWYVYAHNEQGYSDFAGRVYCR